MTRHTNQQNRNDHLCSRCDRPMRHGESYWRDDNADIVCDECHDNELDLDTPLDVGALTRECAGN